MSNEHVVTDGIVINARPEQVWHALTTPEITKQYFFKSEIHSDWKVGGPLNFTRKILFFNFSLKGELEAIEPNKQLTYKLYNGALFGKPNPNKFSMVTITLSPQNQTTLVSISDDVGTYPGFEKRYTRSVKGWRTILTGLKGIVE